MGTARSDMRRVKLPTLSDDEAAALDRKIKRREYGIETESYVEHIEAEV